ncbi:CRP-like cAMP-binding protein [Stackebrandtia albiflava]|uniref:CRP-like cAMP-binding protein n=1 Tax=Stackebrandtia albiflava TaxID=406432 RepID=A0A562VAS4_9ACTN|nr:Crp/Fnr family transcriptional regulator [Stackebrandtia albiflava]TWJ14953.1 CRP-like cAMP-binding protein [Stackebrandtia albiflava]
MKDVTARSILRPEDEVALEQVSHLIGYPANTVLIRQGDDSDFVLYLRQGFVKAVRPDPSQTTPERAVPRIVGLTGPRGVVGEMAVITEAKRTADIVAVTDVEALYIPGSVWLEFLDQNPRVVLSLYRNAERQRAALTDRRVESALSTDQRIAKALLELKASGMGVDDSGGLRFQNIGQLDIAGLAGMSRESVAQSLKRFKARQIVETGRRLLIIRDLDAVQNIAALEMRSSA